MISKMKKKMLPREPEHSSDSDAESLDSDEEVIYQFNQSDTNLLYLI